MSPLVQGKRQEIYISFSNKKKRIQHLWLKKNEISPSTIVQAVDKVIKGAEKNMQEAILVKHQLQQFHTAHEKWKKGARRFIQDGGSLTGFEGQQQIQQELYRQQEEPQQ